MGKILMTYASQTGNTEVITDIIAHYLEELKHEVTVKSFDFDMIDVDAINEYDALLVGTYTWDDGELPYEVEDFYIDIEELNLDKLIAAAYGSADSFYDTYGGAIELVHDHLKYLGAKVIGEPFKIDLEPSAKDEERCRILAINISEAIHRKNQTVA
ncbi:MAG TPA: flavodoxin domain-containing protein [Pseudogracilibacillus sp.]|nr:flavodoxin domain-containing protein [Pseudogracilibacillus sp.]